VQPFFNTVVDLIIFHFTYRSSKVDGNVVIGVTLMVMKWTNVYIFTGTLCSATVAAAAAPHVIRHDAIN
jgi:hypothetical protein